MNVRVRRTVFLGALALAIFLPPLQLAVGWMDFAAQGVAAREAEGSIWNGKLRSTSWHGQALGDLRVGLQPVSLLTGTRVVRITGDSFTLMALSGRTIGVDVVDGGIILAALPGLPALQTELRFSGVALVFKAGRCVRAEGRVQAHIRWQVGTEDAPILLSGVPECAERAAVLPLRTVAGSPGIEAELRIEADGQYRLLALVRDADPVTSVVLRRAGFMDAPGGLSRSMDGRIAN